MKYFKNIKAHIKADNAQEPDVPLIQKFDKALVRNIRNYYRHLEKIADRIGPELYRLLRYSENEELHDGFLLSFSFGDAVGRAPLNFSRFKFGGGKSNATMQILNYSKNALHLFTFKYPRKVIVDIPSSEPIWFRQGATLGQIYACELLATSPKYLSMEWLLDSGGVIAIEFEKLAYRRKKVRQDGGVGG
jgi:hypothetical protein